MKFKREDGSLREQVARLGAQREAKVLGRIVDDARRVAPAPLVTGGQADETTVHVLPVGRECRLGDPRRAS